MKSIIIIVVLTVFFFACSSQDVKEKGDIVENKNTLIPQKEYISIPETCIKKLMSSKLLEQVSVKNYLFKNGKIAEDKLSQEVIIYFSEEPTETQKNELESQSALCNWNLWTTPAQNHPLGFVTATIAINSFENIVCFDFVKKIDTIIE